MSDPYAAIFAYGAKLDENSNNKAIYDLLVSKLADRKPQLWLRILGERLLPLFLYNAVVGYIRHSGVLSIPELKKLNYAEHHLIVFRTFMCSIFNEVNSNVYTGIEKIIYEYALKLFSSLSS